MYQNRLSLCHPPPSTPTLSLSLSHCVYIYTSGPSDLARHPLNIATLSDMWTFNDGNVKAGRLESSPLAGANSTLSGIRPHTLVALGLIH